MIIADNNNQKKTRKHGFQCPWNFFQIVSYLITTYNIVQIHIITQYTSIILGIVILSDFFIIPIVYYGYKTTITDTTDIAVLMQRNIDQFPNFNADIYDFYCCYCSAHVSENAKHCKACNRCSLNFDHHCIWLNNCIAGCNYQQFIKLIVSMIIWLLLIAVINLIQLKYQLIFSMFSIVLNLILAFFLINLLCFHIYLKLNNLTTYQFVLNSRNVNIERSAEINLGRKCCDCFRRINPKIFNDNSNNPQSIIKNSHTNTQTQTQTNRPVSAIRLQGKGEDNQIQLDYDSDRRQIQHKNKVNNTFEN